MMRGIQKVAGIDLSSILSGGIAGYGAYTLADKAKSVVRIQNAPLIAGAVTALLVGSMVASRMRDKAQQAANPPVRQKEIQNQEFLPGERVSFPAGHSFYQ